MEISEFSAVNRNRSDIDFPTCSDWSLSDWMNALHGETGEAANILKKARRGDFGSRGTNSSEFKNKFGKELADALCYLDLVAYSVGLDLETILIDKFNEVSRRINSSLFINPVTGQSEFSPDSSLNRIVGLGVVAKPGFNLQAQHLQEGMIVRYDSGPTALAKLHSPHEGGWQAYQCMDGMIYISASAAGRVLIAPTEWDIRKWYEVQMERAARNRRTQQDRA